VTIPVAGSLSSACRSLAQLIFSLNNSNDTLQIPYDYNPPIILDFIKGSAIVQSFDHSLQQRQEVLNFLKIQHQPTHALETTSAPLQTLARAPHTKQHIPMISLIDS